jgi:hypothetical protein
MKALKLMKRRQKIGFVLRKDQDLNLWLMVSLILLPMNRFPLPAAKLQQVGPPCWVPRRFLICDR